MRGQSTAETDPERFEPDALSELPPELALGQLPVGRHGLPRAFVDRNQRLRIIAAMLRMLPRHGFAQTTIGHVTREAGVSRSAFYGQFESKEDCFLATYGLAAGWLCDRVEAAVAAQDEWATGVRAGASEAIRLLAANPDVARLISVEALQAGPTARARRQACVEHLSGILRAGRPDGAGLPEDLEELLVGGTLSLIARYVDSGQIDRLPDTTDDLVALYFLK